MESQVFKFQVGASEARSGRMKVSRGCGTKRRAASILSFQRCQVDVPCLGQSLFCLVLLHSPTVPAEASGCCTNKEMLTVTAIYCALVCDGVLGVIFEVK